MPIKMFLILLAVFLTNCVSQKDEMVFWQVEGFRQVRPGLDINVLEDRKKACAIISTYASQLFQVRREAHNDAHAIVGAICRSAGIFTKGDIATWERVYGDSDAKVYGTPQKQTNSNITVPAPIGNSDPLQGLP